MTSSPAPRRLIILGSTGSIGTNTVAVVEHLAARGMARFDVVGLAAGNNAATLLEQAQRLNVNHVAIAEASHAGHLLELNTVYAGADAALQLIEAVARPGDLVMGAMVGAAGIEPMIAAIKRGCDIALANKETLVAAGALVMPLARKHGVQLIPVDSEHSAIFQCLGAMRCDDDEAASAISSSIARLVITASGGPFRTWTKDDIENASVEDALNHPTWNMGPKVTIDSASLMNKALEVIEAHWLFGLPGERIDAIVHPQSIIHSFVEFVDGSVIAQLGPPDMRTPIQYALTWPHRAEGCSKKMDWASLRQMDFEPVDHERFRAIELAQHVIATGGTSGAVFNAANEAAVAAFLDRQISFGRITELVAAALDAIAPRTIHSMSDVMRADAEARAFVTARVESGAGLSSSPAP